MCWGISNLIFGCFYNKRLLTQGEGSVNTVRSAFSGHLTLRNYATMQSSSEQERRKASSFFFFFQIFLTEEFTLCFGPLESFVLCFFSYFIYFSFHLLPSSIFLFLF